MKHGTRTQRFVWFVLLTIGCVGAASAQGRSGCQSSPAPSFGLSAGRSSTYIEPVSESFGVEPGSVNVRGGPQLAGRAELPVAGRLRLRLEAARSKWDVRRTVYDAAAKAVTSDRSIGSMSQRHLVAMLGVNVQPCAYVAVGGGVYAIGFRDQFFRSLGPAVAAGMEFPTGARGAIQLDAAVHMIGGSNGKTIATNSTLPTIGLNVGWAYRF